MLRMVSADHFAHELRAQSKKAAAQGSIDIVINSGECIVRSAAIPALRLVCARGPTNLKRREFILFLGSVTSGWPLFLHAQQRAKVYRVAIVHPSSPIADLTQESRDNVIYPLVFLGTAAAGLR
jgi:hypothetical protein